MLKADDVETAFVQTAREQHNGEPFNWQRVALHLNERLADQRALDRPFVLANCR
jgi:hypothetical protein